jgi:glutamate 5-kinase
MRWVIKIGTSSVCDIDARLSQEKIDRFVSQLRILVSREHEILVVTSGAVGAGVGAVGKTPQDVTDKQALAAIGQARLMEAYQRALHPIIVGQVLLTRQDLEDQDRRQASRSTLERVLSWGAIPVINENDTVTDAEIRIGDNDTLAARVAVLMEAHRLVILSDIDGLYTENPKKNPGAHRIEAVPCVTADDMQRFSSEERGGLGTGGMATKLEAARIAQEAGIGMVLAASQEPDVLDKIEGIKSWQGGTRFLAKRGMIRA